MALLFEFTSRRFDVEAEEPNPFNPIRGRSLAAWVAERLRADEIQCSDVEPEDWGWYVEARYEGRWYLLGFIAFEAEPSGEVPFLVQLHKRRSFWERLRGRERLEQDDPLSAWLSERLRAAEPGQDVEVSLEA